MTRFEEAKQNFDEIVTTLFTDEQAFSDYLRFAGRIFKHQFSDSVLIFSQKPDAAMIAEMSVWNRLGRRVNYGTKSIAVFRENGKCSYLFDAADTNGRPLPRQWIMDEQLANEIVSTVNQSFSANHSSISQCLEFMAKDYTDSNKNSLEQLSQEMRLSSNDYLFLEQIYDSCVKTIVNSRCSMNSVIELDTEPNLSAFDLFERREHFIEFCDLVNETARSCLLDIEKVILNIIIIRREEYEQATGKGNLRERDEVRAGRGNNDVQSDAELHERPGGTEASQRADRSLGQGMDEVDGDVLSTQNSGAEGQLPVADNSEGNRPGSRSSVGDSEQTVLSGALSTSDELSGMSEVGEGTDNVDRPHNYDGDSISAQKLGISEAVSDDAAFFVAQSDQFSLFEVPENKKSQLFVGSVNVEKVIHDEIMRGSGFRDGKFRIEKFYRLNNPSMQEFAKMLKDEYGIGGHSGQGDVSSCDHDSKGMKFRIRTDNGEQPVAFNWNDVAKRTAELISNNQYITPDDIEERISHAQYVLNNYNEDDFNNKYYIEDAKSVLVEYDIPYEEKPSVLHITQNDGEQSEEASVLHITQSEKTSSQKIDGGNIQLGDKFSYMEREYTVVSLKGIYPDDVEIAYDSEISLGVKYQVTKNIDRYKLANEGIYLGNINSENAVTAESHLIPAEAIKGEAVTYRLNSDDIPKGGQKTRYLANISAIKTLKLIESENRYATPDEQAILAGYVGWGGIPQAFDENNDGWNREYAELKQLLSEDEYKTALESTLTSFYTPPEVLDSVYSVLDRLEFKGGNILEPALGTGNFLGSMPESLANSSKVYGVELDSVSGRISKKLYPGADIKICGFENTRFSDNSFDVVVGNVPFGDFKLMDKKYDRYNFLIHDYFFAKAVDKVKPGRIIAFVTSKGTLDKKDDKFILLLHLTKGRIFCSTWDY